ncbi:MAG: hypothetical protein ACR2NU_11920 [Aeoliella sp.]
MQFGMFLYERRAITAEHFVAALARQNDDLPQLGLIALEEGKLAVRDLLSVLRVQSDLPKDRFGDIAIELGVLTKRDLAELLMLQSDRRTSFGDCLIKLGILSPDQVADELSAFRQSMERGAHGKVERIQDPDCVSANSVCMPTDGI